MNLSRISTSIAGPVSLGLVVLVMSLLGTPLVLAQVPPWPTPPPAPMGSFPQVIPASRITPVPAPASPGSMALQIDPIFAGPVPRIPPRPSTTILSGETDIQNRIILHIDAGAIDRTLQLTYEPLDIDEVPETGPARQTQRAFRLQIYDHSATVASAPFRYPVRITLSVLDRELAAAGNDSARLFLARFDAQRNRWQPLVTTYRATDGILLVRILQTGLFALIAQPSPVAG